MKLIIDYVKHPDLGGTQNLIRDDAEPLQDRGFGELVPENIIGRKITSITWNDSNQIVLELDGGLKKYQIWENEGEGSMFCVDTTAEKDLPLLIRDVDDQPMELKKEISFETDNEARAYYNGWKDNR